MNKSERKRMLCVSLAVGAILLCGVLLVLLMRYQHTSTVRPQDQYVGQIPDFYSTVDADGDGVDVCTIITCYYLNEDGDLARTIFSENSMALISQDNYFELRRVVRCNECGEVIVNLDQPCPTCNSDVFEWAIMDEEIATQDLSLIHI